jgi:DNA topoisomerase I
MENLISHTEPTKRFENRVSLPEMNRYAAEEAKLRYVNDSTEGIRRKKKGNGFCYYHLGVIVRDESTLKRIKKLAIPPAWSNVWICPRSNGHLQATGYDVKNRKQYRYHSEWSSSRNQTKYYRLYEFGKVLPSLRAKIESDINKPVLSKEKVLATVLNLMEKTCIRVGNSEYEKSNGSYGLTTLKDGHVNINGPELKFSFRGKKGIDHSISLKNKKLARIVRACRDIPGKELFQYIDEEGVRNAVDSGMVNDYMKEATGTDFTAKDLRTWSGSLSLLVALQSQTDVETESDVKKNIQLALDDVCAKLGNTRTVCRKYYVHPRLIELYEQNGLRPYFRKLESVRRSRATPGLQAEEKVLMQILKKV